MGLGFGAALLWPIVLAALGTALIVGRSGRPIDELIGELVRRERGLPRRDDAGTPTPPSVLRVVDGRRAGRRRRRARSSPRRARSAPSDRASSRWR